MRRILPLILLTAAGCTVPSTELTVTPPVVSTAGLERVLDRTAPELVALFGAPELDIQEAHGRKLQFAGPICVLDAYLYPKGGRQAVVTYVDARQPDGRDIDRASCVSALVAAHRR